MINFANIYFFKSELQVVERRRRKILNSYALRSFNGRLLDGGEICDELCYSSYEIIGPQMIPFPNSGES